MLFNCCKDPSCLESSCMVQANKISRGNTPDCAPKTSRKTETKVSRRRSSVAVKNGTNSEPDVEEREKKGGPRNYDLPEERYSVTVVPKLSELIIPDESVEVKVTRSRRASVINGVYAVQRPSLVRMNSTDTNAAMKENENSSKNSKKVFERDPSFDGKRMTEEEKAKDAKKKEKSFLSKVSRRKSKAN